MRSEAQTVGGRRLANKLSDLARDRGSERWIRPVKG